jgi:long-chain acyl-CoA synthetase
MQTTQQPINSLVSPSLGYDQQERYNFFYKQLFVDNKFMFAGTLLQRAAQKFPTATALICKDITITFQQLYNRSVRITEQLRQLGVNPRDKVCLLYENSLTYYQAYFGIWQLGAIVAPLNTFLTEKELEHIISDCKPAAIILSDEFAKKFDPSFFTGVHVVVLPDDEQQKNTNDLTPFFEAESKNLEIPYLDPDEMAALLYTSGTTGFPKGVMLSSKNILTNVVQIVSRVNVSGDDCLLGVLPLFHSFAQNISIWTTFFLGATTIVLPKIERKWIIDGFKHKPTVVIAVPALYGLLCMMKDIDLSSVRYLVSGGDALPDKIRSIFEMVYRRKLCNGYGLTEAAPFVAADLDDELKQTNTIGRPALGLECSLRDEQGNPVNSNQIGILWIKGDNVMLGYYNAPDATRDVLKDGWLNTGDFATFDKDGRLVIVGRFKDLIIHKGFNIYPQEIENILMSYPGMMNAAVVGFPDEQTGEIPVAYVVVKEPQAGLEEQLRMLCSKGLAAYKVPRHFIVMHDLPMTSLGKVDKKKLRQETGKHLH